MLERQGKVFIGADHAGFALKQILFPRLSQQFSDLSFIDCGTFSEASVDYPTIAKEVANKVALKQGRGILICGSGIGMSIAANKVDDVRAAMVWDTTSARLSREHNDANIICLGARLTGSEVAFDACRIWLVTEFAGGRHQKRIDLIRDLQGR